MNTTRRTQVLSVTAAILFVAVAMSVGYARIGLPPVVIVGGSGLVALVMWSRTYLRHPIHPRIILPVFLVTVFAFVGPIVYTVTALGLYRRVPLAGFVAWFIFIGPGVAEFTHFIFPALKPAIQPEIAGAISQAVANGHYVADMKNYWFRTTGVYYFPGMLTAILPMIPGVYAIRRVLSESRRLERQPAVLMLHEKEIAS